MKMIIAGSRHYKFTQADRVLLRRISSMITEVVSGGATGADAEGEAWAIENNIPVHKFPADWETYGRAAGPIRNQQMALYAQGCILFPGGKGTEDMYQKAKACGLLIMDWRHTK